MALRGRAVGPDGQPVRDAWVCSRLMLRTQPDGGWKLWIVPQDHSRSQLRDGRFVLHGLDPNTAVEVPAFFLDPERKLGAVARFSGRSAAEWPGHRPPRALRHGAGPAGHIRRQAARSVSRPGLAAMVVTPGPLPRTEPGGRRPLFAEEAGVVALDPVNYGSDFQSDAQGRLTLPALIPGATYRIEDFTPAFGGGDPVDPQGVHRQAGRDPRPGRHPHRQAPARGLTVIRGFGRVATAPRFGAPEGRHDVARGVSRGFGDRPAIRSPGGAT